MPTLVPTVTLAASLTVDQATTALAVYDPRTMVAVRNEEGGGRTWHLSTARDLLVRITGANPTDTVAAVLSLDSAEGVTAVEVGHPSSRATGFRGLVVAGREAVGITFDPSEPVRPPTRSWQAPNPEADAASPSPPASDPAPPPPHPAAAPPPPHPAAAPPPPPRGGGWWRPRGARPAPTRGAPPSSPAAPPDAGADPPAPTSAAPPSAPGPVDLALHPRLDTPARVDPGARFDVTVGVAGQAQPGLTGGPMTVTAAADRFELAVQLSGDGFQFPDGIRHTVLVRRDDIEQSATSVAVQAPDRSFSGRLEVSYSHAGVPIGRAWKEVVVGPAEADVPPQPDAGSVPIDLTPGTGPDLTVGIVEGMAPGRYLWTFTSPHAADLPNHQVIGPVVADPRSFALGHVKELARADGSELAPQTLMGIARMVSRAAPNEFWQSLDRVWRITRAEGGGPPSVLIVSDERFIPWELASTETDWIDPELLAPDTPHMLGAQVCMGRWLPAGPSTPRGAARPTLPPVDRVAIDRFALVIGDYLAEMGQRPLPQAKEEGDQLAAAYPHVRLGATAQEMRTLLADELTSEGAPVDVQVIHFACHGEVDQNNPAYNGIVLSDTALRLDHLTVAGSAIGRNDRPIVFLNACQLAHDTGDLLGDYGGLAGAFLTEGCRAFVAALWSVNDVAARDIAIEFYRMTIDEGVTAGEALRRIRARGFQGETITPFAYVYYGHPALRLSLDPEQVLVDLRTEDHADVGRN
jgi:hypothetical protein